MTTNSIKHKETRTAKNGEQFVINIRLNDECKNGHQDFSITGSIYEAGKPKTERNMVACGAIGDEIAAEFPEFQIFNNLHLCDYTGVPTHAVSNGFYHLKNGFNNEQPNTKEFNAKFCEYYRVNPKQFETLSKAESQTNYAFLLVELGILDQWKKEADKAIKQLEKLTGNKFLMDSERTQLILPSSEEMEQEKQRIKSGYYAPEKIEERFN